MTTALNDTVVVEPSGLTLVCAYCVSSARLGELSRQYTVSHGICDQCIARFVPQKVA